jgi:sodium-dependent dicarboxylate transporter 2/3/5
VTSNTATAALFIPLMAGLAAAMGLAPLELALPVTLSASCAFMMPVATPPNAIVYAGGHMRVADMARAGFWLNLAAIALITGFAVLLPDFLTG